jgi:hypothetical protein
MKLTRRGAIGAGLSLGVVAARALAQPGPAKYAAAPGVTIARSESGLVVRAPSGACLGLNESAGAIFVLAAGGLSAAQIAVQLERSGGVSASRCLADVVATVSAFVERGALCAVG